MATSHSSSASRSAAGRKAAATRKRNQTRRATAAVKGDAKRTVTDAHTAAETATDATQAETRVLAEQVRQLAQRTVNVPVGAGLIAGDSFVTTVRGIATTLGDRARMERELGRYERRGAGARNRFERQVRRTRTNFEREVRRRRARMTDLVSEAQHRIGSLAP